jgi:hypothetical protein
VPFCFVEVGFWKIEKGDGFGQVWLDFVNDSWLSKRRCESVKRVG